METPHSVLRCETNMKIVLNVCHVRSPCQHTATYLLIVKTEVVLDTGNSSYIIHDKMQNKYQAEGARKKKLPMEEKLSQ